MKSSIHYVLVGESDYKDLAPVFEDILTKALTLVDQLPDEEQMEMIVQMNLADLERNRKPEGYLRKARLRMVFPTDRKEFYFQSYNPKLVDLKKINAATSDMLDKAGVDYEMYEDDNTGFDFPDRKKRKR